MISARPLIAFLLVFVVLFALLGWPGTVTADENVPVLPVALDDMELLPIREIEWAILLREHPALVKRLMFLGHQLERAGEHLKARKNPDDSGGRMLQQEIVRLIGTIQPHVEQLLEVVRPMGIDDDVLASVRLTPKGPMRLERHAMRVVRNAPGRSDTQRALHDPLVAAADATLLTLDVVRSRHAEDERLDEDMRAALLADLDAEILAVQKRFWRVVDSTLDRAQRVALRRRLPTKMAKHADLFGHLYVLPGLDPSQAARLKAMFVRLEAEAAPDKGIEDRAARELAAPGLDTEERRRLEREKEEASLRNVERFVAAWKEGTAILNGAQRVELDSILPLLTAGDRPGDLKVLLGEIALTDEQHPLLADLHARYGHVEGQLIREVAQVEADAKGMGPDSPMRDEMDVRKAQAYGRALAEARRAARELFLVILTPDQVTNWVLGVPKPKE